jgi:hypothetical protein
VAEHKQQQQQQQQEQQQQEHPQEQAEGLQEKEPPGADTTGTIAAPGLDLPRQVVQGGVGPDTALACRAACDAVMAVMAVGQMTVVVQLAKEVLSNPSADLSAASRVLGVLGLALAQLSLVGHILLTLLRPQQALQHRELQGAVGSCAKATASTPSATTLTDHPSYWLPHLCIRCAL